MWRSTRSARRSTRSCPSASPARPPSVETACSDDYDATTTTASRIWVHRVGTLFTDTRLYVFVDAKSAAATGGYTVNVHRRSAAGDSCFSTGGSGRLDVTGGGTVLGFISGGSSARGSCQPATSFRPEAILDASVPPSGVMTLTAYSLAFTPDLYVRQGTCSSGTELGCTLGSSGVAGLSVTPPGAARTHIFVEGSLAGGGAYVLYYDPF